MNYGKITQAYQDAEKQALQDTDDPHLIVLTLFNELLKSMNLFANNADLKAGGELEVKSKHFARSLSIIYALQSSIDFEKNLNVAKSLFQIYEFTRLALINEFKLCKIDKSLSAVKALSEIRDSWRLIE